MHLVNIIFGRKSLSQNYKNIRVASDGKVAYALRNLVEFLNNNCLSST